MERSTLPQFSSSVSISNTLSSIPFVAQELGNLYVVSTFASPGDQNFAFDVKNAGSIEFNFFGISALPHKFCLQVFEPWSDVSLN